MNRLLRSIVVIALAVGAAGCSALSVVNAVAPDDGIEVIADIDYGDQPRQRLDLYRPAAAIEPLPTIVFFYGGSWKRGKRADYAFAGRALARHGFLVAVADYRVYPEVRFPAFVDDGAEAVAWLGRNADRFGGRADGIHLMGHSAGAHIAALLATDERYMKAAGTSRAVLGRWVGLAGPYAFYPSKVRYVRDVFSDAGQEDLARPIAQADTGTPPALLLHGGGDGTVAPSNSIELAAKLARLGVDATAHIYEDVGHAPLVLSLTTPFTGIAPTLKDAVTFLKTGRKPGTLQASIR